MSQITITLPNGTKKTYEGTTTPLQVATDIGKRLGEAAIAAKVDGKEVDVSTPIQKDATLIIITKDSKEGLEVLRHSTAHLLAHAIKELYPQSQITIGPVIEDGFYYDIDNSTPFAPEDLPKIEKKMEEIAARKLEVKRSEIERDKAVSFFKGQNENYKAELIAGFPEGDIVSTYTQGNFTDLCRGPHVSNTSQIGKFKLLSIAGAYWRGDENNKMLQRIYGTAFATQKELDEHLKNLEEAKKRDHRKLGPELGLFTFLPVAPSMPFYLPKGATLFNLLIDHMQKQMKELGFQEVVCPQLMTTDLWATSGHLENYKENMFFIQNEDPSQKVVGLKPMNCPGHCALYASTKHSYRELPIRYGEFTRLHRNERAGVMHGILRTRVFSIDDGHIFCTEEQIQEEAKKGIDYTYKVYKEFGFSDVVVKLATRPEKYIGTIESWEKATEALAVSLKQLNIPFEYLPGEGAFYGPKIEFHIRDSLKRLWQCGTIQLDYGLPERFKLEYVDADGKNKRPVVIHRAILGSLERFMGILIEHHAGHFPLWISPVQATIISVTADQDAYVNQVATTLESWGLRVEKDLRYEKLGYKIREAQMQKTPLMLVLGQKETETNTISVRKSSGETTNNLTLEGFKEFLKPLLNPGGTNH